MVIAAEETLGHSIRRGVIVCAKRANKGHIGSALSVADLVAAALISARGLGDRSGDRIVLSKGHAALALYVGLCEVGLLSEADLVTYSQNGSPLGTHPDPSVAGIDVMTGSLGQGVAFAVGIALGAKLRGLDRQVIAIMSDAELNEGSTWEALHVAQHQALGNLSVLLDYNGQQAFGYTKEVQELPDLAAQIGSTRWEIHEVDGHAPQLIASLIARKRSTGGPPQMIIARTTFGSGVSFMEKSIPWHHLPLNDEQYAIAMGELAEGGVA
jgi:transketolase